MAPFFQPRDSQGRYVSTNPISVIANGDVSGYYKFIALLILISWVVGGGLANGFYSHWLVKTGWDLSSNYTILLHVTNMSCNALGTLPHGYTSASLCEEGYSSVQSTVTLANTLDTATPIILLILGIMILATGATDEPLWLFIALIIALSFALFLNLASYNVGFVFAGGPIPPSTTSTTTVSTTSTTSISTTTIETYRGCVAETYEFGPDPFNCTVPILHNGSFSFTLAATAPDTLYNISLSCSTSLDQPPLFRFRALAANGTVGNGNGTQLSGGQNINVVNMPCYAVTPKTNSFNGFIWVGYLHSGSSGVLYAPTQIYINETSIPTNGSS